MNKIIATWCGKPVSEMSKEELIEALSKLSRMYLDLLEEKEKERRLLG